MFVEVIVSDRPVKCYAENLFYKTTFLGFNYNFLSLKEYQRKYNMQRQNTFAEYCTLHLLHRALSSAIVMVGSWCFA